jgi:aminopeptidase YwaD
MIRFFLRLVLFYFILCEPLFGQDMLLVRKDLQFLTSKKCFGRGYLKHGQQIAADYLVKSFKRLGLLSPGLIDYSQPLSMSVNTFPGKMRVKIDGKKFLPGKDFLVENSSYPAKGSYQLRKVDSVTFVAPTDSRKIAPIVVTVKQKLTWSVAREQGIVTEIQVPKGLLKKDPSRIDLNVDAVFIDSFPMKNICGYFKGSAQPDSFIFFTAHYDHLGGMGNTTFFPGANDNASGVSMLLALARHFKEHPSRYSIGFVLFCGEEAGLLGSRYFVDHSPISLSSIKFLINLDLLGTGDEGITVVNATEFPRAFKCLQEINEKNKYLPQIKPRGKAANSDHYWFTEKNVPCFFIYTMGGIKAYHDVYDVYSTLPLTRFGETYNLLLDFVERY